MEAGVEQLGERLAAIRRDIDKLTLPPPRKRGKVEPLLPHIGGETGVATEDEEEL